MCSLERRLVGELVLRLLVRDALRDAARSLPVRQYSRPVRAHAHSELGGVGEVSKPARTNVSSIQFAVEADGPAGL